MSPILASVFLFAVTILSGYLSKFIKPGKILQKKLLLAFTGAYLFGIAVLSLLPEVFEQKNSYTGLFIIAGFMFQLVLEFFSEGIEHGHQHLHASHHHHHHKNSIPLGLMIGLCTHALLEGLPILKFNANAQPEVILAMLFGISVHNIPISLTLVQVLQECGIKQKKIWLMLFVFAIFTPLGLGISYFFNENLTGISPQIHTYLLSAVVGIFLHISTTILFETSESHRFNLQKFGVIVLGILFSLLFV
jgi:zinc and cadmium transporter